MSVRSSYLRHFVVATAAILFGVSLPNSEKLEFGLAVPAWGATINDNDASIIYTLPQGTAPGISGWKVLDYPAYYDGDEQYACLARFAQGARFQGSSAVVNFNGTGIQWVTTTGGANGIAFYSIDGGVPQSVDTYASPSTGQVVAATISGLAPGSHSLKIEATPYQNPASFGTCQVTDAFNITGTALPPSQGSSAGYNSSALTYTGSWGCGAGDGDLSGGHCWSDVAGSTVSWTFNGSLVEVYGRPDFEDGIVNVLIDGAQVAQVDQLFGTVDDDALGGYCIFTWKGSPGAHTIKLVVSGQKNPTSRDYYLQVDQFLAFP